MTIVTKPLSEKKADKPLFDGIKVDIIAPSGGGGQGAPLVRPGLPLPSTACRRERRVQSTSTACLFLTALVVLSCGILTGLCLYKQFVRAQMEKFQMRCNIPIYLRRQEGEQVAQADQLIHSLENDMMMQPESVGYSRKSGDSEDAESLLQEDFEIDDNYEKISVPLFSGGRKSKFVHDFNTNKTGIIDVDGGRCFVMPLNRTAVLPPDTLIDLIEKLNQGYYEVDTSYVRQTMQVVLPAVEDRSGLGQYIEMECAHLPVYRLERSTSRVYKRSPEKEVKFLEYAGRNTQVFSICNMNELEEHEGSQPVAMP